MATSTGTLSRAPRPSSLADVLDLILDKGLVVDAYVRVSVVGIELLTVDARVVVASVDTYLHFAEAVNRLDITPDQKGITSLFGGDERHEEPAAQRQRRPRPLEEAARPSPSVQDRGQRGQAQNGSPRRQGLAERIVQRGRVEEED